LTSTLKIIDERIAEIAEETTDAEPPTFTGNSDREKDKFDDADLMNLFVLLIES
jgi:hypothetical protein